MIVKNGSILYCKGGIIRDAIAIGTVKQIDGTDNSVAITATNLYLNEAHELDTQRGIRLRLGVGDTPPTAADYWLDETVVEGVDINSVITCQSASISNNPNGEIIYTYSFTNTSTTDYTIKELALIDNPSQTGTSPIMVARTVIPPREIRAGETVTFSYVISLYNA